MTRTIVTSWKRPVSLVLATLSLAVACPGAVGPASAQPPSWPAIDQSLAVDEDESGCADHRNVTAVYYATDATYLYFRMVNAADAGWPGTSGASTEARYKIWFETGGTTATISGTSVGDAEYLVLVEDEISNDNDPNGPRDQVGEMVLLDDLANDGFSARWATHSHYLTNEPDTLPSPSSLWRRTLGTGTAGVGGPQQAMSNADIGFRLSGVNLDFYVSRTSIGNPTDVCVIWASDTQSTNMDQAPNCDRPVSSSCLTVVSPTATPTASGTTTSTATATATSSATAAPSATATPTATNTASDTETATATPSPTATNTASDTETATASPTPTATETATDTPAATLTDTPEATPTDTAQATATNTAEPTATDTQAPTPTETATPIDTGTPTPTETGTVEAAETATATVSATPTTTPSPTATATLATVQCSLTPRGNCRTPRKSLLILQNKTPDKRDIVKFKWRKGAATSMKDPAEFGDPVHTASYSLCIYHGGALLEELHVPAGGTCGSKPCWKPLRNHLQPPPPVLRAYKYRDKKRLTDGVLKVLLRGGTEGKAAVVFKGSGPNLPDPVLGLNQPVVAEVINSETSVCWSDTYSGSMIKRNDAKKFKAKRK